MGKIDAIKASILYYANHFSMYDYAAFAWLILIFFVSILLAIIVAKKSPIFSVIIIIFSLSILFIGPFMVKHYLNKLLRPSQNITLEVKKLQFSDSLIVNGNIKNISKNNYSTCKVNILVVKSSKSDVQKFINKLKPLREKTIFIDNVVEVNATKEFRVVFDNYTYSNDINISINSECY